jgi:hypothetical protein
MENKQPTYVVQFVTHREIEAFGITVDSSPIHLLETDCWDTAVEWASEQAIATPDEEVRILQVVETLVFKHDTETMIRTERIKD